MNTQKRELIYMGVLGVFALGVWVYSHGLYGDIFRFMLLPLGLLWLLQRRIIPLKGLVISAVIILGVAFGLKLVFYYAHTLGGRVFSDSTLLMQCIDIAKRPINGEYKGFPSGHTTAAFIATALAWRYMGVRWGICLVVLAGFVGYSRILNLWHTPLQVCAGAILGFFGTLLVLKLTSKYIDKKK